MYVRKALTNSQSEARQEEVQASSPVPSMLIFILGEILGHGVQRAIRLVLKIHNE